MGDGICAISGCERPAGYRGRTLRGWCTAHYNVWVAYRDPLARPIRPPDTGRCRACGGASAANRLNWCESCYCRTHRNGHSGYVDTHVERPSYRAAHSRIARERGKAREHPCIDCANEAAHWSFAWRECDPGLWLWEVVNGTSLAYTGEPQNYEPRCRRCARRYDMDFARQGWRSTQTGATA